MSSPKLIVISGPSGVGKSTVIDEFYANGSPVWYSVSATTRSPRPGEQHGREYFFLTPEEFAQHVQDDNMLEWAHFSGNSYGTPRQAIEDHLAKGDSVLVEVELQGARQIREQLGDQACYVFLAPPDWDTLVQRLTGRNTEDAATIERRLERARIELAAASEFDEVIVNESVQQSALRLAELFAC